VLLGLSTGHSVGLALVAGTFVAFAFVSALVVPRRWPQFPGHGLGWFIAATLVLFVGTLAAVEVFAKEEPEAAEAVKEKPSTGPGTTSQAQPPASKGDPAAGKRLFEAQGCGGCHAFSAAGTSATIGPDFDKVLKGKDPGFVRESIVDPNKEIAKGYQPNIMPQTFGQSLSEKEIDDLVAFLTKPSP
jgi:mono/diheme cytochrome c family protein